MANIQHLKEGVWIGVEGLVIALLESDTVSGADYKTDMHLIPGTIEIGLKANVSDEALGADDNPIWEQISGMDSVDVALILAAIGKKVEALLLGKRIDGNGVLLTSMNDNAPWVALGFKAPRSDGSFDYIWLYKGKFKPSDVTYHSREKGKVTWNTPTINATFAPRDFDKELMAKVGTKDADVSEQIKADFFKTVYLPAPAPAPEPEPVPDP